MIRLAAIADDFTGATDLATSLSQRGFTSIVAVEDAPLDPQDFVDVDAVVVALKTRTAPVEDAVAQSVAALRRLEALTPQQYYVKYCSTFDSTPHGNIGPVLDAVLDELGEERTVVVPAFPDNGRTVYQGRLFVGRDLLEESPMRRHPLTPMTQSRLADLLRPQTSRAITEVSAATVWSGEAELSAVLDRCPAGYVIVDATTNRDLATISSATKHWKVVSGGAGLALGMQGPHTGAPVHVSAPAGRRLIVCGSASARTRAQIHHGITSGLPSLKLEIAALATDFTRVVDEVLAFVADAYRADPSSLPLIYSVGSPQDVTRPAAGEPPVADLIEQALAAVVARSVAELDVRRLVVAGGETSGAVVRTLGTRRLLIGPQVAPGVCWSFATAASGCDVALALKSGNFGSEDMFTTAWEVLD